MFSRSRLRVGEHLLAALEEYKSAGWAVVEKDEDTTVSPDESGKRPLRTLRVFLQSPSMREVLKRFPALADTLVCDATHTVGNVAVQVYALLGHNPESGGQAVPLAFFLTIAGGPAGEHTDGIAWFFHQCRVHGIPPGVINLFDKDPAWFTALARVQHFELDQQSRVHAAHASAMEAAAAFAGLSEIAAARTLLASIDPPPVGGAAGGSARSDPDTATGRGSATPSATPGSGSSEADLELPLLYQDLCKRHPDLPASPRPVPDEVLPVIAQNFKAGVIQQFGAILLGVCAQLATDMKTSEAERIRVKAEPYAAFQEAHRPLFKYSAVLLLDSDVSAASAATSVGSFLRRYCTPVVGLCYFHAKQALLRKVCCEHFFCHP
jgi:hypothetical protein